MVGIISRETSVYDIESARAILGIYKVEILLIRVWHLRSSRPAPKAYPPLVRLFEYLEVKVRDNTFMSGRVVLAG